MKALTLLCVVVLIGTGLVPVQSQSSSIAPMSDPVFFTIDREQSLARTAERFTINVSNTKAVRGQTYRTTVTLVKGKRITLVSSLPFGFQQAQVSKRELIVEASTVPKETQSFVFTFRVKKNNGKNVEHSVPIQVVDPDVQDFSLTVDPPSQTIPQNGTANATVSANRRNFPSTIFLSGTLPVELEGRIFAQLVPGSIGPNETSRLTVMLAGTVPKGDYTLTIRGRDQSGTLMSSTTFILSVTAPPPPPPSPIKVLPQFVDTLQHGEKDVIRFRLEDASTRVTWTLVDTQCNCELLRQDSNSADVARRSLGTPSMQSFTLHLVDQDNPSRFADAKFGFLELRGLIDNGVVVTLDKVSYELGDPITVTFNSTVSGTATIILDNAAGLQDTGRETLVLGYPANNGINTYQFNAHIPPMCLFCEGIGNQGYNEIIVVVTPGFKSGRSQFFRIRTE